MGLGAVARTRLVAVVVAAAAGPLVALALDQGSTASADTTPLSISVSGNELVNGSGQVVQLRGIDRPGTEYACVDGYGYSNNPIDADDAAAIASWGINAVRIPINEDCWLGINKEPAYGTTAGYQQTIEQYVTDLNADGIYAILDLHWTAPGTNVADGQRPLPDDHSAAFWDSVAGTFATNPAVLFDAFNEPFSPAANGYTNYPVSWACWKNGGCVVPDANDQSTPDLTQTYTTVGMQAMVTAIRSTGATQPIMLGGLSYANDLSGWLANEPSDPLATTPEGSQLIASFHNYEGESCDTVTCWNDVIAPVAAQVPVVTGEFDENECPGDDGWDNAWMNWADANGVSYLAWGWYEGVTPDCNDYYLVNADGSPASPNGVALYDHLQPVTTTTTASTTTASTTTASTTTTTASTTTTTASTTTQVPPSGTTSTTQSTTTGTAGVGPVFKPPPALLPACVVPKLGGLLRTKVAAKLKVAHCGVGKISGPRGRRGYELVVLSSSPKAGSRLKNGAKVAVKLGLKPLPRP